MLIIDINTLDTVNLLNFTKEIILNSSYTKNSYDIMWILRTLCDFLTLSNNLSFNSAVEMLSALGYEVVIQERKPGVRRADQIVIDQKEDPKYDLDALLGSGGDGE